MSCVILLWRLSRLVICLTWTNITCFGMQWWNSNWSVLTDQFDKETQKAFQRSWNKNRKTEFLALLQKARNREYRYFAKKMILKIVLWLLCCTFVYHNQISINMANKTLKQETPLSWATWQKCRGCFAENMTRLLRLDVSVSAMQPFFKSLCLLPLLQHY